VIAALALAWALAPAPARDPDVVAGEAAYREERWDDASVAFDAAWRRTGDPIFLYTRAQVERRAGRCEVAIELYEQFLATKPPAEAGAAAQGYLDGCRASQPAPTPDPTEPPASEPTTSTIDTLPPPSATQRPWSRDPTAAVLIAAGGAAMIAGAALIGVAHRDVDHAGEAPDDRSYGDRITRARRFEIAGATVLPIGALLVAGAAIRWALLARRQRAARVQIGALANPRSMVGLQLGGAIGNPLLRRRWR
jgi:hypothetical protein